MIDRAEVEKLLMMSNCFVNLAELSTKLPFDVTNRNELNEGMAINVLHLILALDDGNILFRNQDDASHLVNLLALALNSIYDGKLAEYVKPAMVN